MTAGTIESNEPLSPERGWKPKAWIAGVLGLIAPLGILYVGRLRLALYYLFVGMFAGLVETLRIFSGIPLLGSVSVTTALVVACAVHSIYLATNSQPRTHRPWYSRWYGLAAFFLLVYLSAFLFRAFAFEPFVYPAPVMFPGINPNSKILIQKWGYGNYGAFGFKIMTLESTGHDRAGRGEVYAFEHPIDRSIPWVSRVIGLPGDTVEMHDKKIILNGTFLKTKKENVDRSFKYSIFTETIDGSSYRVVHMNDQPPRDFKVVVPEGSYLFLGDNRDYYKRDAVWAVVPRNHLIGKVIATW